MSKHKAHRITGYAFGPCLFAYESTGHVDLRMRISPSLITRIIGGHRGLSPELIVRQWECSICHRNYEDCIHEAGQTYGDKRCVQLGRNIEAVGVSIVSSPEESRATITDLLVIEEQGGKTTYKWFGFPVVTENQRFKHIQRALESGLIPEKAAFHFSRYFSLHLEGHTVYL